MRVRIIRASELIEEIRYMLATSFKTVLFCLV